MSRWRMTEMTLWPVTPWPIRSHHCMLLTNKGQYRRWMRDDTWGRGWNGISLVTGWWPRSSNQRPVSWELTNQRAERTLLISDTLSWRKHREEDLSILNNLNSYQPPFPPVQYSPDVLLLCLMFTAMLCYAQVFLTHRELSRWIIFLIKIQIWSCQWSPHNCVHYRPLRGSDPGQVILGHYLAHFTGCFFLHGRRILIYSIWCSL